ncbi:MAG: hypothetical protein JW953_23730 [Anaerolineae bacterium]|nr:hypothetical protein [Anaerolineae bacterium]
MPSLTTEQREYKEKTLEQLRVNFSLLETKLAQESRPEIADNIRSQLEDIRAHLDRLQRELATNSTGEPVADELFQRAAGAVTNKKFYLAKKLINKLETIEPFYPGLERLRQEAETGRASRRTQAIAQRPPVSSQSLPPPATEPTQAAQPALAPNGKSYQPGPDEERRQGLAQFFQFHIIISCLVVLLILCIMFGVGGVMLLQWLIEGG